MDEQSVRATYDVLHTAYAVDDPDHPIPTFTEVLARVQGPHENQDEELYLLRDDDGTPVGCLWLELPTRDNLDLVELELAVHPDHWGRGHGRRLLAQLVARCTELGRHQLIAGFPEPPDGSETRSTRFAAAAGAQRSLGEARRTLHTADVDRGKVAALRADAEERSRDYTVLSWTGPCPDELVDDYAALTARMSTDAPFGDLDIEAEHWDAERVRARDEVNRRQGRTAITTVARRGTDGPLVAFTDIMTAAHDPENAFQWDTLVRREDRGHRLGTLIKAVNLEHLLDQHPDVRRVHTWNADSNSWMVAINEALGFRVARLENVWRLDLPREEDDHHG